MFNLEMHKFIGKFICGRVKQKMKQLGVGGEHWQKSPKKGFTLYKNTDDRCLFIIMYTECMSGKGLPCIEFSLTDRNAVVILEADGIIFALVGEVEIKKVMPVEKLLPPAALMDTDQDFFLPR